MVGVLSAMYDNHWAATLNQAPICKLGVRYFQWPALQRLRAVCDEFGAAPSMQASLLVQQ